MIVFMTLLYCAVLAVLVKFKLVPWNLGAKLSPLLWMVLLLVALFIPMQFYAPAGDARVVRHSVQIVPNVSGVVTRVAALPNVPLSKGDVLFEIDPAPFEATLNQLVAKLDLAELRLDQAKILAASDAGRRIEVDQRDAEVRQLKAQLAGAQWNLDSTTVRAPTDGFVTGLALREGSRVASLPLAPAMAFIDTSETILGAQIPQNYLRHIRAGMKGEAALKYAPGTILDVTVVAVLEATSQGQIQVGGLAPAAQQIVAAPMIVRLVFDDVEAAKTLPAGAVGQVALYTDKGAATHMIRKVMIRQSSWLNYIIPF
jgi:multidrug resistance efflux pump